MDALFRIKQLYANIGKLITSSLEVEDILEGIMEEVHQFFSPENWSLLRLDPNTNELFFVIVKGIDEDRVKLIRFRLGEGIAGTVAQTGKPIFVPDTSKDSRFSNKIDLISGFKTRSIMAVPLIFRDTVYGVIELVNGKEASMFSEDDYLVLQSIADFSAIAFANASIHEEIRLMSTTDALTGILNRAKLNEIIEEWSKRSAFQRREEDREESKVTAIMFDIDNFKDINDKFGHREGDRLLKHIARSLRTSLRNEDFLFRIGGDEFLALAPIAESYHREIIENRILNKLKEFSTNTSYLACPVTLSYGMSTGPLSKIKALIHDADLQMYEQKKDKSHKA